MDCGRGLIDVDQDRGGGVLYSLVFVGVNETERVWLAPADKTMPAAGV